MSDEQRDKLPTDARGTATRRAVLTLLGGAIGGGAVIAVNEGMVDIRVGPSGGSETGAGPTEDTDGPTPTRDGAETTTPPATTGSGSLLIDEGVRRRGEWLDLDQQTVERAAHERVNEYRDSPLTYDRHLAKIARYHARNMALNEFIAHEAPDGETVRDRYQRFGYACDAPAENIAQTWAFSTLRGGKKYTTSRELGRGIADQWFNSPEHKENMLRSRWSVEGIGAWWVEDATSVKVYAA
jgi:uncharacterized protein YkwD